MTTKDAIVIGFGRGGFRSLWVQFLMASGAYYWLAQLAPLVGWTVEWGAVVVLVWSTWMALMGRWWYWAQARRIEDREVEAA